MSFLELALLCDKTKVGFNIYFADSVIVTRIATVGKGDMSSCEQV